ncbi:MAG: hypothetical protein V5A38_11395 [Halolamina sp.]|uniref:DUF7533 family protein n=1 Tax=Halolamina sp. TaxID=1940283 RepID=UPI002FC297CF
MALGIRQMLALGGSLIFAIPLGIYAVEQLVRGEALLGGAALVVAGLMVALPQYLTTPDDLPGKAADRALDRVVAEPNDESATDEE